MGVIQNSINQILTIAAAGAYISPEAKSKTKGIQEAKKSAAQKEEALNLEKQRLTGIFDPKGENYASILMGKDVGKTTTLKAQYEGLKGLEQQITTYEKLGGDPNEVASYRSSVATATEGMKQRSGWQNFEKEYLAPIEQAQSALNTAQVRKQNGKQPKAKRGGKK